MPSGSELLNTLSSAVDIITRGISNKIQWHVINWHWYVPGPRLLFTLDWNNLIQATKWNHLQEDDSIVTIRHSFETKANDVGYLLFFTYTVLNCKDMLRIIHTECDANMYVIFLVMMMILYFTFSSCSTPYVCTCIYYVPLSYRHYIIVYIDTCV